MAAINSFRSLSVPNIICIVILTLFFQMIISTNLINYRSSTCFDYESSKTKDIKGNTTQIIQTGNIDARFFKPNYDGDVIAIKKDDIITRAFDSWPNHHPFPCFPPSSKDVKSGKVQQQSATTGFFYLKPIKTGSSTASGVSLRIARNMANRLKHPNDEEEKFDMCEIRFQHGLPTRFHNRTKDMSFLWTIIRDPTQRAISFFFHFKVSRKQIHPSDENFIETVTSEVNKPYHIKDYYLRSLFTTPSRDRQILVKREPINVINSIINQYDFIGITERMDESLVVLMMLLDLRMSDILHLSSKTKGKYDDLCYYIWPSFVSSGMQEFFNSDEWNEIIKYDLALYRAANHSLDLTIDQLDRTKFLANLEKFRSIQKVVKSRCLPTAVFPCSENGTKIATTPDDCLWRDNGCGIKCLDQISTEYDLW